MSDEDVTSCVTIDVRCADVGDCDLYVTDADCWYFTRGNVPHPTKHTKTPVPAFALRLESMYACVPTPPQA